MFIDDSVLLINIYSNATHTVLKIYTYYMYTNVL